MFTRRRQRPYVSTDGDDRDEGVEWPYCNGKFSQNEKRKQMSQVLCFMWCHEDCASGSCGRVIFVCDCYLDS
jgi:uncharacterized protein involved in tellurium resistance